MPPQARLARRDTLGGLDVLRVPHCPGMWLVCRRGEVDAWQAEDAAIRRTVPCGLTEGSLPTQRSARALRALLLTEIADWSEVERVEVDGRPGLRHPDRPAWTRVARLVAMADVVLRRRGYGLCLGCGMRPGMCDAWQPSYGPRFAAEELAWIR